jgi:pimeloyl-ACP methyl ester carboxylesterase
VSDKDHTWVEVIRAGGMPPPVVLVLGGFLTSPPLYRPFAARLRDRGAADVVVGSVWTMDWLLAASRGLGPILTRSGRALLASSARSEQLAQGAPVMVIGHSAGGMSARILTAREPFAGRRLNASGRIGAIVTLGTPHVVSLDHDPRRAGTEAAAFANRVVPGPAFAPGTGYLAVGSRRMTGRPHGTLRERRAWRVYRTLVPDPVAADAAGEITGDGLIPLECALLPGARAITLDDADHGQSIGTDWYGAERFIDAWWPTAVEAWRGALGARVAALDLHRGAGSGVT